MHRTETSVRHVTVPRARGPTRSRRGRLAGSVAAALLWLCCPGGTNAQDPAWRLELDALLQEGDLVRDELDRLQPAAGDLAKQGAQLDAEDQSLRTASQALNDEIQAFNSALDDLQKAAQAQQARCPRESEDSALVEACNAEAARIREQASARDAQRPLLKQRQEDLNRRIAQHNTARHDWAARKSKHDGPMDLNRRDLVGWLERAQRYFDSNVFQARYRAAGNPAACRPEGLQNLAAAPSRATLERVHACLLAIKEGP
jgi:cell division septum initiation protein DivIVA